MDKKVLVLYYTQSGQLEEVVKSFTRSFIENGVTVELVRVKPKQDFPFPWTAARFFDAMPESVLAKPVDLESIELKENKYDLVVFAYQPWFLSLSIPANSILQNVAIKGILKNTPVISLIAARNMWLNSQERLKKILQLNGANLVANIALIDKSANLVSAITIMYWMFTAKRDKYLGIFPKPGVLEQDVTNTEMYGKTVLEHLKTGNWAGLQQQLVNQGAVKIQPSLMFVEERAPRLFYIWANLITNSKNRTLWVTVFKYYLLFALFIVAPIILAINALLFQPFMGKSIAAKKKYYLGLSENK